MSIIELNRPRHRYSPNLTSTEGAEGQAKKGQENQEEKVQEGQQ